MLEVGLPSLTTEEVKQEVHFLLDRSWHRWPGLLVVVDDFMLQLFSLANSTELLSVETACFLGCIVVVMLVKIS